jgi:ubiquinone/menaquinone biosynthesis C-methylase UbiE
MTGIDPEVIWYYNKGREAKRLATSCRLEEARTRRIIARRLDGEHRSIIDIGGGAGAYALWLTRMGHAVHLLDPVSLHIEQARAAAEREGVTLAGLEVCDAESLRFDDESFDVALSLGPLYHIIDRSRRVAAVRESYRVLRPGGMLFAAAITRYGSAIEGFFKGYAASRDFVISMQRAMRDGQHRNPRRQAGLFTTAYFHQPPEFQEEIVEAGFADVDLVAIEGPWTCIPDFEQKWEDAQFRSLLMDTIELMEADPSVIGFGGHIMAIARRPTADERSTAG